MLVLYYLFICKNNEMTRFNIFLGVEIFLAAQSYPIDRVYLRTFSISKKLYFLLFSALDYTFVPKNQAMIPCSLEIRLYMVYFIFKILRLFSKTGWRYELFLLKNTKIEFFIVVYKAGAVTYFLYFIFIGIFR